MPVVTVSCLPDLRLQQRKLRNLHKAIVETVENIEELGLKGKGSVTVLFPLDMMKGGLGTEIIIEVTQLLKKSQRTLKVRQRLADHLRMVVERLFPKTKKVECFVCSFDPKKKPFSVSGGKVRKVQRPSPIGSRTDRHGYDREEEGGTAGN